MKQRAFHLRRATRRDIDTLVMHRHAMFEDLRHRTRREHLVGDRAYRKFVLEMLARKTFACFVVETKDREIVASGCVWLRERQPHPGKTSPSKEAYLMSMYTKKEHRGKGFATKIVKEAIKWAKKKGYSSLNLHASFMGRPVYKKLGFKRTHEMVLHF
ncbi:MAG: GNAT family N-acetyltransferase [Nitrososphaerales archaeon]